MTGGCRNVRLQLSLEGPDLPELIDRLERDKLTSPHPVTRAQIAFQEVKPSTSLRQIVAATHGQVSFDAVWDMVRVSRHSQTQEAVLAIVTDEFEISESRILDALADAPFEIASIGRFLDEWGNVAIDDDAYRAPGWSGWHFSMGWAAAFKGEGHNRLVSRRWLETGPWRLLKGPNDTSLVIFHDLEADAETALAQAKAGHAQIGITDETGFLQSPFSYRYDLNGLYDEAAKVLKVVVHGRDVPPRELLEWAAIRANQRLGSDKPISAVRFIFPEEASARKHLPSLWRYEHECWAIIDGDEVRLDTDEMPTGLTRARS
jgi:hypothetical protein